MRHIVGVSDMKISTTAGDIVVTHALGSCVGIAIHDPVTCIGGIVHFMLPQSKLDLAKAQKNPFMFGDTGIPLLFTEAYKLGAKKENIRVVMAGGANVFEKNDYFEIGKRNQVIAKKMFWKNNVLIAAENCGGSISRTLYLEVGTGITWLTSQGNKIDL